MAWCHQGHRLSRDRLQCRELLRRHGFITLSLAFALGLLAQIVIVSHLMAHLTFDFGSHVAAMMVSLVTLCVVIVRTVLSWLLGDRDARKAAALNFLMQAAGSLLVAFGDSSAPLIARVCSAGCGSGRGVVTAINQATFAFGPAFFGWLHDLTHDYAVGFAAAGVVQVLAAMVVSRRQRFS